jgi:hypothetical protein
MVSKHRFICLRTSHSHHPSDMSNCSTGERRSQVQSIGTSVGSSSHQLGSGSAPEPKKQNLLTILHPEAEKLPKSTSKQHATKTQPWQKIREPRSIYHVLESKVNTSDTVIPNNRNLSLQGMLDIALYIYVHQDMPLNAFYV